MHNSITDIQVKKMYVFVGVQCLLIVIVKVGCTDSGCTD